MLLGRIFSEPFDASNDIQLTGRFAFDYWRCRLVNDARMEFTDWSSDYMFGRWHSRWLNGKRDLHIAIKSNYHDYDRDELQSSPIVWCFDVPFRRDLCWWNEMYGLAPELSLIWNHVRVLEWVDLEHESTFLECLKSAQITVYCTFGIDG